ncbi:porphobilinogen synthase [Vallitalea okinawensis]|uniref:porphobilinogen synthase n=1 Tax=Vallitalea okinawensis TaxID=2078660 RepID=UPI000CFABC85|nr:porphobilinogen synthase [Vallitalea okinawensis]
MFKRTRSLRRSEGMRHLLQDVHLTAKDLVYPIFIDEGDFYKKEIPSMPGQFRYTMKSLNEIMNNVVEAGIGAVILFGIPAVKDEMGKEAYNDDGIIQKAIRYIKKHYDILVITDVCMCEYTSHGHCGILEENGDVNNDITIGYLSKVALSHTKAGADIVAPSDMMDGRVQAIRSLLDQEGYQHVPIMAYSVKYASSFYGPFRDAADSAPSFGDRRAYQMDFRRQKEYLIEAEEDLKEGADFLIIKPAGAYMDIIKDLSDRYPVPIACYHVSGEYAMIKAAAQNGWIDEKKIVMETMYGFKRAGADIIITYFALDIAEYLKEC